MSVNKVILVGRLGSDPETRYTNSGQAVSNFSLATDSTYKDRSGERQKKTEWHKLIVWGKLSEIVQQYLHKGDQIYVEGRLQSRQYESQKDSATHTVVEIVVSDLKMLSTKREDEERPVTRPTNKVAKPVAHAAESEPSEEDIPF